MRDKIEYFIIWKHLDVFMSKDTIKIKDTLEAEKIFARYMAKDSHC